MYIYSCICNQESFLDGITKPHMFHCLILNHVTTVLINHDLNIYERVWDFTQKYFHLKSKTIYNGFAKTNTFNDERITSRKLNKSNFPNTWIIFNVIVEWKSLNRQKNYPPLCHICWATNKVANWDTCTKFWMIDHPMLQKINFL